MEKVVALTVAWLLLALTSLPLPAASISSCNGPCTTLNDCAGQLICINRRCTDDPQVGTHICTSPASISSCNGPCTTLNDCASQLICINRRCTDDPQVGTHICASPASPPPPMRPPPPPSPQQGGTCTSSGSLYCQGVAYPTYLCSPPVTSSTRAILTENDFGAGGDGGAPSECDEQFHSNSEYIVALSTGWYAAGSRCGRQIMIRSTRTGRSVTAKVVDECDSMMGCDAEHAGQPPCRNNIVDASSAVWNALGLNIDVGEEDITWSMV